MSSPRIQRQVRQQRADIASVYELLDEVRGTVAGFDAKVDAGFAAVKAKIDTGFAEVLSRTIDLDGSPWRRIGDGVHQRSAGGSWAVLIARWTQATSCHRPCLKPMFR